MKRQITFLIMGLIVFAGIAYAQEEGNKERKDSREEQQTVTDEQKTAVKEIISKYDVKTLTADDAKTIHRALRDAGIRGGRVEDDLLQSIGFDPEILKKLDPPPNKPGDKEENQTEQKSGKKSEQKGELP